MSSAFTGRGWRFPILPDAGGRLGYSEGDENVEHSLRTLLLTSLGERVMRYDFGCRASQLVFAPGSHRFLKLLETSVREAIRDWEPRVEVERISAEADAEEPQYIAITLWYLIRRSNTRGNLVFPFYLDSLEAV